MFDIGDIIIFPYVKTEAMPVFLKDNTNMRRGGAALEDGCWCCVCKLQMITNTHSFTGQWASIG